MLTSVETDIGVPIENGPQLHFGCSKYDTSVV